MTDRHEWEGSQEQASSSERVDCPERRQCEDEVDYAETEGSEQCWSRLKICAEQDNSGTLCQRKYVKLRLSTELTCCSRR